MIGRPTRADVMAPDHTGHGTNALLLAPPQLIAPRFGPESFRTHLRAAHAAGTTPQIVRSPGLEYDIDEPADLQRLLGGERAGYAFLSTTRAAASAAS